MAALIRFALSNFTVSLFVIGLFASSIALLRTAKPLGTAAIVEALFSYFLLFSIGISFFYNFVMHTFFGGMSARFIGWADSPFQAEVGFASLGYAAVGFLAFRGSYGLRLAAVLGPSLFLLGAAAGHVYQISKTHNFAPGNSGAILYSDVLIPVTGFVLLWLSARTAPPTEHKG